MKKAFGDDADALKESTDNSKEAAFRAGGGKTVWETIPKTGTAWTASIIGGLLGYSDPAFDGVDDYIVGKYNPEKYAAKKKEVLKKWCDSFPFASQECMTSYICENQGKVSRIKGALVVGSGASRGAGVTLAASRSPPIISESGSGESFIYAMEFLVRNPLEENLTVQVKLDTTMNGKYLSVGPGGSLNRIAGNALIKESTQKASNVCLVFTPALEDSAGDKHSEVCAPIIESATGASAIGSSSSAASAGSSAPADPKNVNAHPEDLID